MGWVGRSGRTPAHRSPSRGRRRGKETSLNSGARPPSPPPFPPQAGFRRGRRAGGGWDPSPQRAPAQSPGRASPGQRGRGGGKVQVGRGVNPAAPRPPTEGGGEPWPLKEEQVGWEEKGGGKRRPIEREELEEGGSRWEPPRRPLHLPHTPQPRASGCARGGYPGLPQSTLKPRVLRSETKSSFFERSGCALELCDSGRAGERGAGGDRGEGRRSPDPESRAPHSRPPPRGHPVSPLSRCGARATVKVIGRTAQRGTEKSGPCGQSPPNAPHTSRPLECNVTERREGPRHPCDPGCWREPSFQGARQEKDQDSRHLHRSARSQKLGGPMQHLCSRRQKQQVSSAWGPPRTGDHSGFPEILQPPPKFLPLVSRGNKSPPHVLPPPPPVSAGVFMLGGPGRGAPTPGRSSRRPRCPVPSRARRAALTASPGLASQSLSPPRRRLPG